ASTSAKAPRGDGSCLRLLRRRLPSVPWSVASWSSPAVSSASCFAARSWCTSSPLPRRPRPLPLVRGVVVSAASPSPLDAIRAAKNRTAAFPWVPRRETRRARHISRRARPRPRCTTTKMGAAGAARRGHAAVEPPSTLAVGGGQEGGVRRPGIGGGGREPQQEETTTLPLSGRR
ncbi:unnamed protein product, partial [Urochloa humidicola]